MYTGQHKLCTDTNTVLDIVKATSFYPPVMRYFTYVVLTVFCILKLWYKSCGIKVVI